MSLFYHIIILLHHYFTKSLCYFFTLLCHYCASSLFHFIIILMSLYYVFVLLFIYSTRSFFFVIIQLCHHTTMPLLHYIIILLPLYYIFILQCLILLCHYSITSLHYFTDQCTREHTNKIHPKQDQHKRRCSDKVQMNTHLCLLHIFDLNIKPCIYLLITV